MLHHRKKEIIISIEHKKFLKKKKYTVNIISGENFQKK